MLYSKQSQHRISYQSPSEGELERRMAAPLGRGKQQDQLFRSDPARGQ